MYAIGMQISGVSAQDLRASMQRMTPAWATRDDNKTSINCRSIGYVLLSGGVNALADRRNSTLLIGNM